MNQSTPYIISAQELNSKLDQPGLVIVDLSDEQLFAQGHIPGARHLPYPQVVRHTPPIFGLLPSEADLSQTLSQHGISPDSWVVAYDEEGGGKAARLLWTLEAAGHSKLSLLDGGIHGWKAAGLPTTSERQAFEPSNYPVSYRNDLVIADRDYIRSHLDDNNVVLLDARSPGEYEGSDVRAAHGGHIPGAVNFEWTDALDRSNALQLLPESDLNGILEAKGINKDKEIIVYCHSHHRSALSYAMLKQLGYNKVRGYPGSWSDWGNQDDTPIE